LLLLLLMLGSVLGETRICIDSIPERRILSDFSLACPGGLVINKIEFASFGIPSGSCIDNNLKSMSCWGIFDPSDAQIQADRNARWMLEAFCINKRSCQFNPKYLGSTDPTVIFGDACPLIRKYFSAQVRCGRPIKPPPLPEELIWDSSRDLNVKNFVVTTEILDFFYRVAENRRSVDHVLADFNKFQLVLDDDHSAMQPFRFLPIFTDEPSIGTLKHVTRWSAFLFKLPLSDTVLLAFRGTDNPKEWLTGFDQSPSPLPEDIYAGSHKISVHRGFLNLYLRLRNQIFAGLQSLKPKSILIAGHSLGASLASLATLDISWHDFQIHSVYLYGSPRVGDPYLAQAFHQQDAASNVYRIANTMDIVTDLPSSLDFDSVKYTHITGLNYTYEFIPLDESIMNLTRADFLAWAHSLSTYRAYAPMFIPSLSKGRQKN